MPIDARLDQPDAGCWPGKRRQILAQADCAGKATADADQEKPATAQSKGGAVPLAAI